MLFLPINLWGENYTGQLFTEGDGLPQRYVYTLNQDYQDFIWLGTDQGIFRFDGHFFYPVSTSDTVSARFITTGLTDDQTLYFATMDGRIYARNELGIHSLVPPKDWQGKITCLAMDPDHVLWASVYNRGFIRVNPNFRWDNAVVLPETQLPPIHQFAFLTTHEILAATNNGLYVSDVEGKTWKLVSGIPETRVLQLITTSTPDDWLVVTRHEGIYRMRFSSSEVSYVQRLDKLWPENPAPIQCAYLDATNRLYLAINEKGLFTSTLPDSGLCPPPLPVDAANVNLKNIHSLYTDREGTLWCGSYGEGLLRLEPNSYSFISSGSRTNQVLSIQTDEHHVWLGTDNGLLRLPDPNDPADKDTLHLMTGQNITALHLSGDLLWVGTRDKGLFQLHTKTRQLKAFPLAAGKPENHITTINGRADTLWVGTVKGLCRILFPTGEKHWYTISQGGLPNNRIMNILPDASGTWVATRGNTLSLIQHDTILHYSLPIQNGNLSINSLTCDGANRLWIGTLGGGLFYFNGKQMEQLDSDDGLASNYCYAVTADRYRNIWVSHQGSISRISWDNLHIVKVLPDDERMAEANFISNSVHLNEQGILRFGYPGGFFAIDTRQAAVSAQAPQVHLHRIRVNGIAQPINQRIVLAPGTYHISFEFQAINQKEPELIQYEYQLINFDNKPIRTRENHIDYPNTGPGKYCFEVFALKSNGVPGPRITSVELKIRTSPWKNPLFYSVTLSLLFIGYLMYSNRQKKKIRLQNQLLAQKVKKRTRKIEKQKELLKQQNEQLAEQQEALKEANATKDKFFSIIAHDLKNPLNAMLGFSSLLEAEYDRYSDLDRKQYISIINQASNGLNSLLNNLLDWSRIQTGRISYHPAPFPLDHIVSSILDLQASAALNKNIELHPPTDIHFTVYGDEQMMRTVLQNLVSNAIKFTQPFGNVYLDTQEDGSEVRVSVKDDGVGIRPEDQEKLFRIDKSFTTKGTSGEAGTGLGLTLCKEFVEMHGSNLQVRSEPGLGTTFWFHLKKA